VALRVVKAAQPEPGVDYFDARTELLFDTPFAVARVVRGVAFRRAMTVEAAVPVKKPGAAEYRWVVLQGDPAKIGIKPLAPDASRVEITVAYHGVYRPQGRDGQPSPLQSARVDIGCFAKAGPHWSAPSFVSFYCLPNEERVYRDDGRILSVDYANAAHRYADPVLTFQKGWKDLYEYDGQGRLLGWYRTRGGGRSERFTWRGHKVLETDAKNRPVKACAVQYLPRQTGVEGAPPSLSYADTQEQFVYAYADDGDKVGKASPAK
jgi:YD repeat-containing protein